MGTSEESLLVARGVKSLRIFVENLENEGATLTTRKHLKDASIYFSEADRKTGLRLDKADKELVDILAEEKCHSDEIKQKEEEVGKMNSEIQRMLNEVNDQETRVAERRSRLSSNEQDVRNAEAKLEKEKKEHKARVSVVGAAGMTAISVVGALGIVATGGLAAPFVALGATGAASIGSLLAVGNAGLKMVENAKKVLDGCQTSLSEAETNLKTANERLRETKVAKSKLEQTLVVSRYILNQAHVNISKIKEKKKTLAKWQTVIRETIPVLQRIDTSTNVLKKESETQFKMKALADFSLLIFPLNNLVNNVIELDGNRYVDFESMRADVQSIQRLTEKMKAIDDFNEDDLEDFNHHDLRKVSDVHVQPLKKSPAESKMSIEDEDKKKVYYLVFGIVGLLLLWFLIGNVTQMMCNLAGFVYDCLTFIVKSLIIVMAVFSLLAFEKELKKEVLVNKALLAFGTAMLLLFWFWFGFWFFVRLLTTILAAPSLIAFSNSIYSKVNEKTNINKDFIAIGITGISAFFLLWFLFV